MPAKLVVNEGPDNGKIFPLADDTSFTIGRGETATIRLTDPAVSRAHCLLEYVSGRAILADSGSRTGTRVNGKAITKHELRPDEIINVGSSKLRFQTVATLKPAAAEKEPTEHPELRKLSGTKLAHFELGPIAGVGNSGVVFRARDFKEDREVALKVYERDFAQDDVALQRFIRAVKTMLPMRHKNLVTLYGGGKTGPFCWMAMEYVEGENLKETIARIGKQGYLEWRTALRMAIDVGNGLYYLHGEDIIHRSLSPGNLLLSRLGTVKLASLILAKALSGELAEDVTVGNDLPADVRFLAPEQVGGGGTVDGRADVYSLGVLLYTLLTGKTPFEAKSLVETVRLIVQREVDPPRQFNPSLPAPLEKSILKMLAKKSTDRYQSVGQLLEELEQLSKA